MQDMKAIYDQTGYVQNQTDDHIVLLNKTA
jgi:hypothetical protein